MRRVPGVNALASRTSLAIVAMLAIGIGATTGMYSIVNQVLVRPLPVPQPERLVNLGAPGPKGGTTSCSAAGDCEQVFSYLMFRDLEREQQVFTGIAGHRDFDASLSADGEAEAGSGVLVSGSYFEVLGITPALGRLLDERDDRQIGGSRVAVLGHTYWKNAFAGDTAVIGRQLMVNGQSLTIVGVAPAGFSGTTLGVRPQVFVPITLRWLMEPTRDRDEDNRRSYWVYLFARLDTGVTIDVARDQINSIYSGLLRDVEAPLNTSLSDQGLERFLAREVSMESGSRGQSMTESQIATPLLLLFGLTVLVLLIVCINVAGLLLTRGIARMSEMAVRATVGATGRQLAAGLLAELSVLAIAGASVGWAIAFGLVQVASAILPANLSGALSLSLSPAALGFAVLSTVVAIFIFGLLPLAQVFRVDAGQLVKSGGTRSGGSAPGIRRVRAGLAVGQIVFSLVLLILAGLFARSLGNLADVDLGIDVAQVVSFSVSPRTSGYATGRSLVLFEEIESALGAEPGVTAVGSARIELLTGRGWGAVPRTATFEPDPDADNRAMTNAVSPGFFSALSMPLLAGRDFTESDTLDQPRVAVVNREFLAKFNIDEAIGTRITLGRDDYEIVGVVGDAAYRQVRQEPPAQLFVAWRQLADLDGLTFYLRGSLDRASLMQVVRRVVSTVDPALPVRNLQVMNDQVDDNIFLDRFVARVSLWFAAVATFLACAGLYAVLAHDLAQRTREIGLRLALGATARGVRVFVMKRAGVLTAIGVTVGIPAAVLLGRVSQSLLFGISAHDPLVLAGSVSLLAIVVLITCYLPARHISSLSPNVALRHE